VNLIWLLGSVFVAAGAIIAARSAHSEPSGRRRIALLVTAFAIGISALLSNPLIRMLALGPVAEKLRSQMLADATTAHGVGQTTDWLIQRYGHPYEVHRDERDASIEHWWYTPGPWYLVHEDYVGFTVANGLVSSIYLQVN
jgi:hypothetical protein